MRVRVLFLCTETQLGACLLMRPRSRTEIVRDTLRIDRKSTRLNSSHGYISYAVFCLKKKNLFTPQFASHQPDCLHHIGRRLLGIDDTQGIHILNITYRLMNDRTKFGLNLERDYYSL